MPLVFADTCTGGWGAGGLEAFPTWTERPREGSKHPLKGDGSWGRPPRPFRSDSGPPSTPHVTQGTLLVDASGPWQGRKHQRTPSNTLRKLRNLYTPV